MARAWSLLSTLILATLAVLAACGGGDNKTTTTPTSSAAQPTTSAAFNVCSLLTADEAGAATGQSVADGVENSDATSFFCEWRGGDSVVSLELITGTAQAREDVFEQHNVGEPIEAIGNRAQFTELSGVDVLTDDYFVEVTVLAFGWTDDQRRQPSRNIAELVLTRLPEEPPPLPTAGPATSP